MADETYAYPFDPTGTKKSNLIENERHTINPPDYLDFYFVVPFVGPFFAEGLKVVHYPSGQELIDGVDFVLGYKFLSASRATASPMFGAISLYDREISGTLEITYQTIGGEWTIDEAKAAEMLSNAMNNPRITTWEQVIDLPRKFPVIDHEWDLDDMVGASEVVEGLESIRDAIGEAQGGNVEEHLQRRDNPHEVTKGQVGLGLVQNYTTATIDEARGGERNDRYMTALRVSQAIEHQIQTAFNDHVNNTENPHNVQKYQVGLGNVDNFATASSKEARDGERNDRFMTPLRVSEYVDARVSSGVSAHAEREDNPHGVTKDQVALGDVDNFPTASSEEAREGLAENRFMTPLRTHQAIDAVVGEGVDAHANRRDNPHQVDADQVGLSNLENFPIATDTESQAVDRQDRYMTPHGVGLAIENAVGQTVSDLSTTVQDHETRISDNSQEISQHIGDENNPHNVTMDDVGGYTAPEIDSLLSGKLDSDATADNSQLLEGQTLQDIYDGIADVTDDVKNLQGFAPAGNATEQWELMAQMDLTQTQWDSRVADDRLNNFVALIVDNDSVNNTAMTIELVTISYRDGHTIEQYGMIPYSTSDDFGIVSDETNHRIELWRRVPANSTITTMVKLSEDDPFELFETGTEVSTTEPAGLIKPTRTGYATQGDLEHLSVTLSNSFEDGFWSLNGGHVLNFDVEDASVAFSNADDQALAIEGDGNALWLVGGTGGKMATSTDNGINWTNLASTPTTNAIRSIAYSDGIWFVGDANGSLFSSNDDGSTWSTVSLPDWSGVSQVVTIVTDGNGIIIVVAPNQIAVTEDNGTNWQSVLNLAPVGNINDVAIDTAGELYLAGDSGLFTSDLVNAPVEITTTGLSGAIVFVDSAGTGTVIAVASDGRHSRYKPDNGAWKVIDHERTLKDMSVDHTGLWAGLTQDNMVVRSVDDGKTWSTLINVIGDEQPLFSMGHSLDGWMIGGEAGHILVSVE